MSESEREMHGLEITEAGHVQVRRMRRAPKERYWLHITLFVLTYASCSISGLQFVATTPLNTVADYAANLGRGFFFGTLVIFFLSAHEFGHYFAARIHGVKATLPFYIPVPLLNPFGTMGAVIRMRQAVPSRRVMFDIGVAGPLAGFVVALAYLVIGMATLPGKESLLAIHPEYRGLTSFPDYGLNFGGFFLFSFLKTLIIAPGRFFPGMNEIYHYPLLAVGWFGMFVTALNMIPVGQLDGGHIIYSMFGRRQHAISRWFMRFLLFAGAGTLASMLLDYVRTPDTGALYNAIHALFSAPLEWVALHASWWLHGWIGWLLWYGIIRFIIKVKHPPVIDETPLDRRRMIIGWAALVLFVLTFTFTGIYEVVP
jgi:membrane-associated protease RseP (regulator of RpoE activity)